MTERSNTFYRKPNKTIPFTLIGFESGEAIFRNQQLTIEGGNITEVAPADGSSGLFVTAGFINCHTHWLMNRGDTSMEERAVYALAHPDRMTEQAIENARDALKMGITFAADKGAIGIHGIHVYRSMMSALEAGEAMTHFLYAPWAFMSIGGFGAPYGRVIYDSTHMKLALEEMKTIGGGIIKFIPETIFLEDKPHYRFVFPREAFSLARQTAREQGWIFAVHAKGTQSLDVCIKESVDCIEHAIMASDGQLRAFQEKNIYMGYTLDGLLCRLEFAKKAGQRLTETTFEWEAVNDLAARAAVLNSGRPFTHMLFSSDAGSYKTPHASLRELYLMRKAGIPAAAVLEAATVNGAKCLKQANRGSVEVGKRADLILWKTNPLELSLDKWENLDDYIEAVVLNGTVIPR